MISVTYFKAVQENEHIYVYVYVCMCIYIHILYIYIVDKANITIMLIIERWEEKVYRYLFYSSLNFSLCLK